MSAPVRVGLVTCRDLPAWEVDDAPLRAALRARGAEVVEPAWDDAAVPWDALDGSLVRTTWDYAERRDAFVAWADRAGRAAPLWHPASVLRWNTDKRYLRDLEARGVAAVPTVWLDAGRPADVAGALAARGWARGFLKPVVGASARETLRFDASRAGLAAAEAHLARTLPREAMMLQPYLAAVEAEGELSAVFIDGAFTHGVRKVPRPGDWRVQDDHGAHDEPWAPAPAEVEAARAVLAAAADACPALGRPLYARVDLLRDGEGALRLVELEVTEPSLFFRHGAHAAEALADALLARVAEARRRERPVRPRRPPA